MTSGSQKADDLAGWDSIWVISDDNALAVDLLGVVSDENNDDVMAEDIFDDADNNHNDDQFELENRSSSCQLVGICHSSSSKSEVDNSVVISRVSAVNAERNFGLKGRPGCILYHAGSDHSKGQTQRYRRQ
jgi:hypothetical protein